jgi:hypothetical protein
MARYQDQKVSLDVENKRRFFTPLLDISIDVKESDEYVVASFGERLDLLAFRYYGDASFWWIIAAANPSLRRDSVYLEPGTQVRVPINYAEILNSFNSFNQL